MGHYNYVKCIFVTKIPKCFYERIICYLKTLTYFVVHVLNATQILSWQLIKYRMSHASSTKLQATLHWLPMSEKYYQRGS